MIVIGALVILGSAISLAAPDLRLSLERSVMTPAGLDAIAALRIAIGLVFVLAASASRAPRTLRVIVFRTPTRRSMNVNVGLEY